MFYSKFDSYYYSRPVSYASYNPRLLKKPILDIKDSESQEVMNFFRRNSINAEDLGGLDRGIRFDDLEVGRRVFNHNGGLYYADSEYFIRQWKETNNLG